MGIRQWLNQNPAVGGAALVVLLLIAVVAIARQFKGSRENPYRQSYFFDVQSGDLFVADSSNIPPCDAPSGAGNGVRAVVFSCGDCSDEDGRFIGWLEQYTAKAKQIKEDPPAPGATNEAMPESAGAMLGGHLIAAEPTDGAPQWCVMESEAGAAMMRQAYGKCGGAGGANLCTP